MLKKPVIGILGGIGSGKSTASGLFADLGCRVIDADVVAHEVLNEPHVVKSLVQRWGSCILDSLGRVNRKKIAAKVFDEPKELNFLNSLIHPRVLERCEVEIQACQTDGNVRGIVLDMPLLMEVGWKKKCDFLVFVDCSEAKKAERIAKNAKFDAEELKKRENFQFSLDKKKEKAHYVVHNNSDKSDMAEQIAQIFSNVLESR
jgi:dephospho-CoA kinase